MNIDEKVYVRVMRDLAGAVACADGSDQIRVFNLMLHAVAELSGERSMSVIQGEAMKYAKEAMNDRS